MQALSDHGQILIHRHTESPCFSQTIKHHSDMGFRFFPINRAFLLRLDGVSTFHQREPRHSGPLSLEEENEMSVKTIGHRDPGHASNAGITAGSADRCIPASQKMSDEEQTRLTQIRAYGLWEKAGRPEGDTAREQFWCEAEKEISAVPCK